jgi:hypothetical protein
MTVLGGPRRNLSWLAEAYAEVGLFAAAQTEEQAIAAATSEPLRLAWEQRLSLSRQRKPWRE